MGELALRRAPRDGVDVRGVDVRARSSARGSIAPSGAARSSVPSSGTPTLRAGERERQLGERARGEHGVLIAARSEAPQRRHARRPRKRPPRARRRRQRLGRTRRRAIPPYYARAGRSKIFMGPPSHHRARVSFKCWNITPPRHARSRWAATLDPARAGLSSPRCALHRERFERRANALSRGVARAAPCSRGTRILSMEPEPMRAWTPIAEVDPHERARRAGGSQAMNFSGPAITRSFSRDDEGMRVRDATTTFGKSLTLRGSPRRTRHHLRHKEKWCCDQHLLEPVVR